MTAPKAGPLTTEIRTMTRDIQQLSVGRPTVGAPVSAKPGIPTLAPLPTSPTTLPIQIPSPAEKGGGKRWLVIAGIFLIVVLIGWGIASLLGGGTSPTPTPSASVSQTPAPTLAISPRVTTLLSYFPGTTQAVITPITAASVASSVTATAPLARSVVPLSLQQPADTEEPSAAELVAMFMSGAPSVLTSSLGNDAIVLAYGQVEGFDAQGTAVTHDPAEGRLILIMEVSDTNGVTQAMKTWEDSGMTDALSPLLGVDPNQAIVTTFTEVPGTSGFPIRYRNFPYPDKSIDWGIAGASSNTNYLIISGSRESFLFATQQLTK